MTIDNDIKYKWQHLKSDKIQQSLKTTKQKWSMPSNYETDQYESKTNDKSRVYHN